MLSMAVRNTKKLVREMSAQENVRIGRFFTKRDTAACLSEMFRFEERRNEMTVLDPGAGTGILSAALLEAMCKGRAALSIRLICYENNALYLPMLKNNIERLRRRCKRDYSVKLIYEIREENFLLAERDEVHDAADCIIMNPPSELCEGGSPEALTAKDVLSTPTVDLSYLFLARAMLWLVEGGQMAVLLPTAFASGVSLSRLREAVLADCRLTAMHLFSSKKGLKKHFLIGLHRTDEPGEPISVAVSSDDGSKEGTQILPPLPYQQIVHADGTLLLLSDMQDLKVLSFVERLPCRFSDFGLRMHTGLTLPSRYPALLRNAPGRGVVPLIHPRHLEDGRVNFPLRSMEGQFLAPNLPSLIQRNRNMLLIKRFPAKTGARRLVCAAYMASQASGYRYISTHNKLNYVDREGEEMDAPFLVGIYAVLSTTLYDGYIRTVSHSGQINATEFADLPLPNAETLRAIGKRLLAMKRFEPEVCDIAVIAELKKQH